MGKCDPKLASVVKKAEMFSLDGRQLLAAVVSTVFTLRVDKLVLFLNHVTTDIQHMAGSSEVRMQHTTAAALLHTIQYQLRIASSHPSFI